MGHRIGAKRIFAVLYLYPVLFLDAHRERGALLGLAHSMIRRLHIRDGAPCSTLREQTLSLEI